MHRSKNPFVPYEYELQSNKNNSFGFVTQQGIEYEISFKLTDYLFKNIPELSNQTFEFIISPVFIPKGVKPLPDEWVPSTVATIFYNFIKIYPTM